MLAALERAVPAAQVELGELQCLACGTTSSSLENRLDVFDEGPGSWACGASVEKADTPRTIAAAVNRQKARLKARLLSFRLVGATDDVEAVRSPYVTPVEGRYG